jgi:Glycosyl hydrolases family 18
MKNELFIIFALTCLALSVRAQNPTPPPTQGSPAVIAYYATKTLDLDSFPTDKLTHIIFSFCHLRGNRMIVTSAYDSTIINRIVGLKTRNSRLKVILSMGGWAGCRTCSSVFSTKKGRRQFSRSVRQLTDFFHTDGIDLDWEYPALPSVPGYPFSPDDKQHFTLLLQKLRKKLARQDEISFAAGGFTTYLATSVDWKKIAPLVNHINLMTYDLVNGYDTVTGHHTPLYSTPRQHESIDHAVRFLDSAGVPLSKLVIGAASSKGSTASTTACIAAAASDEASITAISPPGFPRIAVLSFTGTRSHRPPIYTMPACISFLPMTTRFPSASRQNMSCKKDWAASCSGNWAKTVTGMACWMPSMKRSTAPEKAQQRQKKINLARNS